MKKHAVLVALALILALLIPANAESGMLEDLFSALEALQATPTPEPTITPTAVPAAEPTAQTGEVDPMQALLDALAANPEMSAEEIQAYLDALQGGGTAEAATPEPTATATPEPIDPMQALLDALAANPEMSAEEIQAYLDALQGGGAADQPTPEPVGATPEAPTATPEAPTATPEPAGPIAVSQADYQLMSGFMVAALNDTIAVQVPAEWGNNASGRAFTSYSPANRSGAIDPASGTLSTSWFATDLGPEDALSDYEDGIRKMNIASDVASEAATAAGQQARRISYKMKVGSNQYDCKAVCFSYEGNMYAVELTQGVKSASDYVPVFEAVVDSIAVMNGAWDLTQITAAETPVPGSATPTPAPVQQTVNLPSDLGSFTFAINGHMYAFPLMAALVMPGDLPLDLNQTLPYDLDPAAHAVNGIVDVLINTQVIAFDGSSGKELAGLTNLTGSGVVASAGMLTALVDTQAPYVNLTLPCGIAIGQPEALILTAFPEFVGWPMDGLAGFRGNDLLYACNVRDDGCNGYVIIRNDAPFYSTLSIICENGLIREINFECLGSIRANGIFQ